jgi:hypothetical protein
MWMLQDNVVIDSTECDGCIPSRHDKVISKAFHSSHTGKIDMTMKFLNIREGNDTHHAEQTILCSQCKRPVHSSKTCQGWVHKGRINIAPAYNGISMYKTG